MIKVKMLSTGEVVQVTNNVAFDLIDSKKAERADKLQSTQSTNEQRETPLARSAEQPSVDSSVVSDLGSYPTRQMTAGVSASKEKNKKKSYKTK